MGTQSQIAKVFSLVFYKMSVVRCNANSDGARPGEKRLVSLAESRGVKCALADRGNIGRGERIFRFHASLSAEFIWRLWN